MPPDRLGETFWAISTGPPPVRSRMWQRRDSKERIVGGSIGWLACWWAGRLVGWLVGGLAVLPVGWWEGRLGGGPVGVKKYWVGRLAGWRAGVSWSHQSQPVNLQTKHSAITPTNQPAYPQQVHAVTHPRSSSPAHQPRQAKRTTCRARIQHPISTDLPITPLPTLQLTSPPTQTSQAHNLPRTNTTSNQHRRANPTLLTHQLASPPTQTSQAHNMPRTNPTCQSPPPLSPPARRRLPAPPVQPGRHLCSKSRTRTSGRI